MNSNDIQGCAHAIEKMTELGLKLHAGAGSQRDIFQIGYNAGKIATHTGWGRAVWDALKDDVESGRWEYFLATVRQMSRKLKADFGIELGGVE